MSDSQEPNKKDEDGSEQELGLFERLDAKIDPLIERLLPFFRGIESLAGEWRFLAPLFVLTHYGEKYSMAWLGGFIGALIGVSWNKLHKEGKLK